LLGTIPARLLLQNDFVVNQRWEEWIRRAFETHTLCPAVGKTVTTWEIQYDIRSTAHFASNFR